MTAVIPVLVRTGHDACGVPRRLVVLLIRPSRYDDEGYVVRHWRGTLPSNTLACLDGLTREVIASGVLEPVEVELHTFDEAVDRVEPRRLGRLIRRRGTVGVAALAGVQTNQFPRASDLARQLTAEGFQTMIGGFHVSGSVAMSPAVPPECQALLDDGITLVAGEVEQHWGKLLQDAAAGRLAGLHNLLHDQPTLTCAPLPVPSRRLLRKFAVRGYGTIDASRGCPFNCSFCTIINVQGRFMRSRNADAIVDHVRQYYRFGRRSGLRNYFFTDDNFSRNPEWEAILDGLIALRRDEDVAVDFMIQVDTVAARLPRFVEKAARAGCVQVFIGMESLREDNLRAAGKRQNKVSEYRSAIARWHEAGIVCHVGYIIGFPFDTAERVEADVRALAEEVLADQASFFMLTPLPGSRDHRDAVAAGVPLDADFNKYDSFHAVRSHPLMSAQDWTAAYERAWDAFYSFDHMRQVLLRQNPHTYWGMLKCFLWYRAAMIERSHPMVTGFVRLKDRRSRRPGFAIENRMRFFVRRVRELSRCARDYAGLLLEMQELWLATRIQRSDDRAGGLLRRWRLRAADRLRLKARWSHFERPLAPAWTRWPRPRLSRPRDLRNAVAFLVALATERF